MDLRPWQLWTRDGRPSDVTEEVVRVLESVLKRSPLHPGANHYYIHTMEGVAGSGEGAGRGEAARDAGARRRAISCTCRRTSTRGPGTSSPRPTATPRPRASTSASCSGPNTRSRDVPADVLQPQRPLRVVRGGDGGPVRAREAHRRQADGERDAGHRRHADARGVHPAAVLRAAALREVGRDAGAARARGLAAVDDGDVALRARRGAARPRETCRGRADRAAGLRWTPSGRSRRRRRSAC